MSGVWEWRWYPDLTAWKLMRPREWEILMLLWAGLSIDAAIARALGISAHTVHAHLTHLYEKTATHNRLQLLRWGSQNGLVVGAPGRLLPSPPAPARFWEKSHG